MTDLIAIQKIAGWEKLKMLVRHSVSPPITKRVYSLALDEFLSWFQQAPRSGFTKATVSGGYLLACLVLSRICALSLPAGCPSRLVSGKFATAQATSANITLPVIRLWCVTVLDRGLAPAPREAQEPQFPHHR